MAESAADCLLPTAHCPLLTSWHFGNAYYFRQTDDIRIHGSAPGSTPNAQQSSLLVQQLALLDRAYPVRDGYAQQIDGKHGIQVAISQYKVCDGTAVAYCKGTTKSAHGEPARAPGVRLRSDPAPGGARQSDVVGHVVDSTASPGGLPSVPAPASRPLSASAPTCSRSPRPTAMASTRAAPLPSRCWPISTVMLCRTSTRGPTQGWSGGARTTPVRTPTAMAWPASPRPRAAPIRRAPTVTVGRKPLSDCTAFDYDGNQRVTIDELILAVRHALEGCG